MARTLHVTPFGELVGYPWINKPDGKFNPENPVYKADIAIDASEVETLIAKLEGLAQEAHAEHVDDMKPAEKNKWSVYRPWEDELDDETGEPTGRVILRTKQNSIIKTKTGEKKTIKIGKRDAKDKPMTADVWSGSTVRLMFSTRPITVVGSKQAGIRLDLAMVQVKELSEGTGGRGFGAVDGYSEDEADAAHEEHSAASDETVEDY